MSSIGGSILLCRVPVVGTLLQFKEVIMVSLIDLLKRHDWYYMYSDDHSYYSSGSKNQAVLVSILQTLDCPYVLWDIHKALFNMIKEDYILHEEGHYYKEGQPKYTAKVYESDLIAQEHASRIITWLEKHDDKVRSK